MCLCVFSFKAGPLEWTHQTGAYLRETSQVSGRSWRGLDWCVGNLWHCIYVRGQLWSISKYPMYVWIGRSVNNSVQQWQLLYIPPVPQPLVSSAALVLLPPCPSTRCSSLLLYPSLTLELLPSHLVPGLRDDVIHDSLSALPFCYCSCCQQEAPMLTSIFLE